MFEKFFTLEEAEELLPQIEKIMEHVLQMRKNALEAGEALARAAKQLARGDESLNPSEVVNRRTEVEFLVRIIDEGLEAIAALGAQVKDLDMGLVDFPAMIEGETVLLCWKYGEKGIQFYHNLEDGFAGRKPLVRGKPEIEEEPEKPKYQN
ncbi:MAG: DUF2203 domain-containing protein [Acidobacteria bacterium]|nr:MAG: DUF2203 domain-containing protein [Acidobacteriota bacterium]